MNVQPLEIVPPETPHDTVPLHRLLACPLFESVTELSEGLKPVPETVTVVPSGPKVGLSGLIVAVFSTVKDAEAESPITLPVALTLYGPTVAVLLTVNVQPPEIVPPESPHDTKLARPEGELENVTEPSEGLKPIPETVTKVPSGPKVGLSGLIVAVVWTVKDAEAESDTVLPVTFTL